MSKVKNSHAIPAQNELESFKTEDMQVPEHASENSRDIVLVIDVTNYKIIWANQTFCKLKTTNLEKIRNKTCYEILKALHHHCPVGERICPIQLAARYDNETEVFRNHCSCISARGKRISSAHAIPVRGSDGLFDRMVLYAREVTDLSDREDKMGHEMELLERIWETTSSFIVTLDKKGRITYFNAAARFISGYSLDEVIGREWESVFALSENTDIEKRNFLITKGGRKRYMKWNNTFMKDTEKNIVGVVCIGQDITEREKAKRDLDILHQFTERVISRPTLSNITMHLFDIIKNIFPGSEIGLFLLNSKRDDFLPPIYPDKHGYVIEVFSNLIESQGWENLIDWLRKRSEPTFISRSNQIGFLNSLDVYFHWFLFPLVKNAEGVGLLMIIFPEELGIRQENLRLVSTLMAYATDPLVQAVEIDEQIRMLKDQVKGRTSFMRMIGRNREMQKIYDLIPDVAQSNATILITGESGTGKELVSRAIHESSPRNEGPFIVANCAAYPSDLLESELFGHEKGAFTGAIRCKKGRFEQAHKGTLFLDEIGEVSLATQILLLRVLQDRRFERVGGEKTMKVDVRIIAATNRDLEAAVNQRKFREDLFYRLNVINIHLPPLRERTDDIPLLSRHFLEKHSILENKKVKDISKEAIDLLLDYHWPGNARELENVISRAVILTKGDTIESDHISLSTRSVRLLPDISLSETEKQLITKALSETNWNKQKAARKLEISRSTLYSKIKRYNLMPANPI
ncbi:MAG: sigma 54-interacting transcriptional regulator [Thermodesulfobacteriota bacterium]|nr:sigma 54-interacting transcriptional regulator [Thermodesulfobacteriota bacterium]